MPSQLRRHDEPGHIHFWTISCYRRLSFLWHDDLKRVVVDGFKLLQSDFNICIIAYVIMPDHIHFVLYPHPRGSDEPIPISTLLHRFKRFVGIESKKRLRKIWRVNGELWSPSLNRWATGEFPKQQVFNARGYDFNIRRFETLIEKIDYCHKNPVTRGLENGPGDWRWSSFRFYELGDSTILKMDWDCQWPVVW